ncbi:MAG: hypothetical protein LJE85_03500 [Gammaproteobacteria bacterium]|nr:hypothetical protein [Gammaproteobacteria bacterium]
MIWIYCSLLTIVAAGVAIKLVVQQKRHRLRLLWSARWLQALRTLLELFPQHRGMANALLKGDESFRPALQKLQQQVDTQLQTMRRLLNERDSGGSLYLLQPIEQQWQTIRDHILSMQAKKSFAAHTQLVALVIERMQDDSIELEALAHNNGQLRLLLTMLAWELPHVVESIGQARGIGTGVAAERASNVATRVNLKYLHEKTASIINHKLLPAHGVIRHYQGMEEVIDKAVSSAQEFLELLERELITTVKPTVAPEMFYQQGTTAIVAAFQLFDQLFPRWIHSIGLK